MAVPVADRFAPAPDGTDVLPGRPRLPGGWPVFAILLAFPAWYVLGLGGFIWVVLAVPMLARLLMTRTWRAPRGFVLWLLFLAWTGLSAVQLATVGNWLTYLFRTAAYAASAIVFLYLVNTGEDEVPARRIVTALTAFWALIVAGGYLALVFPHVSFATPVEHVLPGSLASNRLLHALVHPSLSQAQALGGTAAIGHAITRPAAPFAYTNWWGATFALLVPFAVLAVRRARSLLGQAGLACLLAASLVPFVISVNRGAWLSLIIAAAYALARLAGRRHARATLALLTLVVMVGAIVVATPLGGVVRDRIGHAGSEHLRLSLYQQSVHDALKSPVTGYGVPLPQPVSHYTLPNVGTQGQLWLVLVSVGLPGTFFFLAWLLYLFWSSRSAADELSFTVHVAVLIALLQLPFYGWLPAEMFLVMLIGALLWRAGRRTGREASAAAPPGVPARTQALPAPPASRTRPAPADPPARAQAGPDLSVLARGGTLNVFGLVVSGAMQLILTVVVARGLRAGGTGAFFEAVALFMILSNIGELGADTGLVRTLPRYRAQGRTRDLPGVVRVALRPVFAFCVGLAMITWLAAPRLAALLAPGHPGEVVTYLRTLAPFIPLAAASTVALAGTRGMGTMAPFVWIQNVMVPALRPVLVSAALAFGLGWLALALGWAAPLAVALVLGVTVLRRMTRRARDQPAQDAPGTGDPAAGRRALSAEFWRFARPRALAAVFSITITWLDILLVGALLHSPRQAGVYAAASRLSVLGALTLNAVGMAIAPQVSELTSRRLIPDAQAVFQVATWWLMALTWPLYLSLGIFAPFLLGIFGHAFVAGQAALAILCGAQLFNLGTGNVTVVLLMAGKSSWNLVNAGVSLALNIALNVLLIPRLGITGAAVAWAASLVCNNLAAMLEVNYLLRIRPFGRGYWVVAACSVACFGVAGTIIRLTAGTTAASFAIYAVLSVTCYALLLWRARETLRLKSLLAAIPRRRPAPASR